jgi:hypothetical protein
MVSSYLSAVGKWFLADVTMSCISPEDFSCGFIGGGVEQSFPSLMFWVLTSLSFPVSVDLSSTLSTVVTNVLM